MIAVRSLRVWDARALAVLAVAFTLGFTAVTFAQQVPSQLEVRLLEETILLDGLDPVLLIQGQEAQGRLELAVTRGHFKYLFARAETKATFQKNPEKYEVQMGGLCARMGAATGGDADLYAVHDGKIYLFGSSTCKVEFLKTPERFLEKPAAKWEASRRSQKRGRDLLAKAVQALGGSSKLDSVRTYRHQGKRSVTTPNGTAESPVALTWTRDGRAREERSFGPTSVVTVLSPGDAFVLFANRGRNRFTQLTPAQQAYDEMAFLHRALLPILQARRQRGFRAAALDAGEVGGVRVERVAIRYQGLDVTLGIDPVSGRVHSMSYQDRGNQGVVAEITEQYSDFRPVAGLVLPFQVSALANGAALPQKSYVLDSIEINPQLNAGIFERPEEARKR